MLQDEEKRKDFQKALEEDKRFIDAKKEEMNRRTEQEIKEIDEAVLLELDLQQVLT